MKNSPWQQRIQRAQELAGRHSFAADILGFYIHVARFQEDLHRHLSTALNGVAASPDAELTPAELLELSQRFESFLFLANTYGPKHLAELTEKLRDRGRDQWRELLNAVWISSSPSEAEGLLARAFLQPYAELLRARVTHAATAPAYLCPFCGRKPGFGVLRQMGDGSARSLVCSFCLAEWEFRRLVCPGCGEENDKRLPVFTATDFNYIRVECCDSCKIYIKTVDLTKDGHAEPIVDELASAPLDLWARDHGYAKLQINLLGI